MLKTMMLLFVLPASLFAWGSHSLEGWTLGTNPPVLQGAGDSAHIHVPVGTSPFYYDVGEDGEGSITFWIHDPANCMEDPNPGYPNLGPMWGLQTSGYHAVMVGIYRHSIFSGCKGYIALSTIGCYSCQYWFKDGVRSDGWGGWYQWTVLGEYDAITFTLHDVSYYIDDGPPL